MRLSLITTLWLLLLAGPAVAQDDEREVADPPAEETGLPLVEGAEEEAGTGLLSDEQAQTEEQYGVDDDRDDSLDPFEKPDTRYYFVGAFYRQLFLPSFLMNPFMDNSTGASNPAGGLEFTMRKAGFSIVTSLWFAGAGFKGAFRASGDPLQDTEILDSSLSALFASVAFLWSTEFSDILSFEYGVGVGLGLLFGDLVRTEAYRDDNDRWQACDRVGDPAEPIPGTFCSGPSVGDGQRGEHYGVKARRLTDGGKVPNIVPWLAIPRLALRIKPIRQLAMRVEGGFGIGFFFGFSASYGF